MFEYDTKGPNGWQRLKGYCADYRKSLWRVGAGLLSFAAIPVNLAYAIDSCANTAGGGQFPLFGFAPVDRVVTSPFLSIALYFLGRYFFRSWLRCNQLNAEEAMEADPRKPILYLRPFKADGVKFVTEKIRAERRRPVRVSVSGGGLIGTLMVMAMTAIANAIWRVWAQSDWGGTEGEALLIEPLKTLGPVVAVARPGERVPPIGAARLYARRDWQQVVRSILDRAQLVLMFAGTTPGFQWELNHIFDRDPFIPTIIILPFFQRYSEKQAARFAACFRDCTGYELQGDLRYARAVYAPDRSRLVLLGENPADVELNFISPFLSPIAQAIEMSKPGWTALLTKQARQERLEFEEKLSR
jgi:hypothetical protein